MSIGFDLNEIRAINKPHSPDDFPVDPLSLRLPQTEIVHISFSRGARMIEAGRLGALCETQNSFTILMDKFYVFYRDGLEERELVNVLFHEFGHIAAGHVSSACPAIMTTEQETAASEIGMSLRAPADALLDFGITTPEQIREKTGLSAETSEHVARQVAQLERKRDDEEMERKTSALLRAAVGAVCMLALVVFTHLALRDQLPPKYTPVPDAVYYWTDTAIWQRPSNRFHLDPECKYIYPGEYEVFSGPYEEAKKGRVPCVLCRQDFDAYSN